MAIDTSLFLADIPAGTYAVGDKVPLTIKAGPSNVRSGRGAAILKRTTVGIIGTASGSLSYWKISVKNSDWVDPMKSATAPLSAATALDERSGCIQRGNDCPLTPNSSWEVVAECVYANTTTVANTIFALIDVDYPSVAAIVDPDALPGIPATIDISPGTITSHGLGAGAGATWDVFNVDIFKAGFEYALAKVEAINTPTGFMAIANAAGMGGLCRIIPVATTVENIRNKVEYATKLVKGPMDVMFMGFANSATPGTATPNVLFDFVKRRV